MHKKWRRILPFVPTEDRATRLKQMASLATALASSNAEFSNELTYITHMSPRSSNQARFEEGGIQVLHKEDKETMELCRTMQQRGQCPPLLVVFDSHQGNLCVCYFPGNSTVACVHAQKIVEQNNGLYGVKTHFSLDLTA